MRPRKCVLLVNVNDRELSLMRLLLDVRGGYLVVSARDAEAATAIFRTEDVDLVLGYAGGMLKDWAALAERFRAMEPMVPILVLSSLANDARRLEIAPAATLVLDQRKMMLPELLQALRAQLSRRYVPQRLDSPRVHEKVTA